ncbi:ExeM/NucH family extracellular endonuclease [Bailinhaonella thermotolerans]|uniref:ExeM/NucH family extracellular endonuclease n=1 Tax=Bailinhaonella thermotolerans TaxID=1070861 RepID=A0A3A4BKN4_9ACTN|nr:ExeM/NucH family extracellular endonuclease [Bailinhaonella thermotolerans]RJL31662.1 ExeM/NucH family extracellular endonuclease [Bailinhaonella thermotolerans]
MRLLSRAAAALTTAGLAVGGLVSLNLAPASAEPGAVVISQVYGGGGNSGAPYTHDFVELFNRGSAPVSLAGWTVQYTSAAGTGHFAANKVALSGTVAPGGYHLVQLGAGAGNGAALPAPDTTGGIAMGGTGGKVALVGSADGLACNGRSAPCTPEQLAQIRDLVAYGSADFYEGTGPAPALSNTTAGLRKGGGCADTDDNAADVEAGAPAPRNSASPAAPCGGSTPDPTPTATATPTPTPSPTASPDCDTPVTHQIAEVQGTGDASPLAGKAVRVEGVVTADFQAPGQLNGFYVQDDTPDADPRTSEGLFVHAPASAGDVKPGDRVRVSGTVKEYEGLTEVTSVSDLDVCGTGSVRPLAYKLPRPEGVTFEPVEGMLTTFREPLTVTDHYRLGQYGEIAVSSEGRVFQPTDREGVSKELNARRTLVIDDAAPGTFPATIPHTTPRVVRLGDTTLGVTGVMSEFKGHRLLPTKRVDFLRTNPRLPAPLPLFGNVKVAGFNTLNWFTTDNPPGRGANNAAERERQLAKLVAAIKGLNADVVGLMEVENNGDTALNALVEAVNAKLGAGTYKGITHPLPGTDQIKVAMMYKPAKVSPVGAAISDPNPVYSRPPLAQTFQRAGGSEPFTLIVNHFKSKGCGDATGPDADHGQGCWNATRVKQAEAINAFIAGKKLPNPMVLGDLNAYGEEDPIKTLEKAGLRSVTKRFVPAPLRYSYLFQGQLGELDHALTGGNLSARVTGATIWHINSDETAFQDYNIYKDDKQPDFYTPDAFRSSDHDPVLIALNLRRR